MPVYEKDGKRIMFAHVPKAGGSSISDAFLAAGYTNWHETQRVTKGVARRRQHAIAAYYRKWGPFTESFAVVRHPVTKFLSDVNKAASRYQYFPTDRMNAHWRKVLTKAVEKPKTGGNHHRSQTDFLLKDTQVYRFEDKDHRILISQKYGLGPIGWTNRTNRKMFSKEDLDPDVLDLVYKIYFQDFILWYPDDEGFKAYREGDGDGR